MKKLLFLFLFCINVSDAFRRHVRAAIISAARGGKANDNDEVIEPLSEDDDDFDYLQLHPLLQVPCAVCLHNDDGSVHQDTLAQPIRTYCDTGAQRTVMSWDCAENLGLLQHLDRRYAGRAIGVGSCRVLGRIPAGIIRLHIYDTLKVKSPPITIIESTGTPGVDMLLGLDFLRDYQAVLNLREEEFIMTVNNQDYRIPFIRPRQEPSTDTYESSTAEQACPTALNGGCTKREDEWNSDDEESSDSGENLDMSGV